jgi:hypothetical protein
MRHGLLLLAAACVSGQAQTANFIEVYADQSQVLVGRTLQVNAVVRDVNGVAIPDAAVTWSVNQAAATISGTGLVTAKGLATVRVTARSGGASGEAALQCIPSKVEVTPGATAVDVGSKTKFTAYAYDADGSVIPNVAWSWSLTNLRQGGSSLGRIDSTGMLTATGEGGIWVWATYFYNESFPGLQQRWAAYSSVTASAPKTYEVHKIYSTLGQTRGNWTLRAKQSMIWSTDDGQLYFNASLSGLANGLVNWNNGTFKMVAAGGVPHFGRASTSLEFRTHAITHDGQILSYEDTNINGTELNLGTRDELDPFLNNNVPLGGTEAVSGLFINRNSMVSSGWKVVRANFRFPNEPTGYTGLFRGIGGADEMLISTKDTVPGITAAFSVDSDFGVAGDGTAFYSVTSGATRIFFKHDFSGRTRLIGVGDPVGTSKVRSFLGGRTNEPATWFDEDGTATVGVLLEDNTQWYLSFAPDGRLTTLRLNSQTGILWRNGAQGVLLYGNPFGSAGNGIYWWKNGAATATQLLPINGKLLGQTVQEVESGTMDVSGAITLMVRGDRNALMVVRMDATPRLLFQDGDPVNLDMPVNLFTLIGGARTGPPHTQAGGNSGSISRFLNGDWEMTLGMGERIFGTTMWFGGFHGTTYNMRKAPNGDVWFINSSGLTKIAPGGAPQLMQAFSMKLDANTTINNPGQLDVNDNGAVLFNSSTSAGDSRFFIWQGGQVKQILAYSSTVASATTIDGRIASSFDNFAIDGMNRVIAQVRFRNVSLPSIVIWDGTSWTTAAIPGVTKIGNHTVTNLPNIIKAAGSHLVAGLTIETGSPILAEWTGSAWKVLVDIDTIMPNGQVANSLASADMNGNGDVLFQFSNGVNSMVVLKNGTFRQVHDFFRPTPDGDWLLRINAMDLRDDGTVYFLAVNQFDEVVLYQADPVN